jgi:hypothetical protein
MNYEDFIKKFEIEFYVSMQDEDEDGELIIRPNVQVAVNSETIKTFFNKLNQEIDLDKIYKISEEIDLEFDSGVKVKLISKD